MNPLFSILFEASGDRISRNLDSYASAALYRGTRLARVATFLRGQLHRCYGEGWEGAVVAGTSEPGWLRAFWRWCGVRYVMPLKFPLPRIAARTTKEIRKEGGVWYCYTTHTTPADLHEAMMADLMRNMAVPAAIARGQVSYKGHLAGLSVHMEARPDFDAVHRMASAQVEHHYGGQAVTVGPPHKIEMRLKKDQRTVTEPKGRIVRHFKPQTTMTPVSQDILILRRGDLKPGTTKPHDGIQLEDFDVPQQRFNDASDIAFIDGCRQKVLKRRGPEVRYNKASYHARSGSQVVDGRLVVPVLNDGFLGFEAGTVVCEPWTDEDTAALRDGYDDDAVLAATVTREGILFHDQGVFIPKNPT